MTEFVHHDSVHRRETRSAPAEAGEKVAKGLKRKLKVTRMACRPERNIPRGTDNLDVIVSALACTAPNDNDRCQQGTGNGTQLGSNRIACLAP